MYHNRIVRALMVALLLPLVLASVSCGSSDKQKQRARQLLLSADSLCKLELYAEALSMADSATEVAPSDSEILKLQTQVKQAIRRREAEKKLLSLDSQARELIPLVEMAMQGMEDLSRTNPDLTTPRYTHPLLSPLKTRTAPHLRAHIDTTGLVITSVYAGEHSVGHSSMRLSLQRSDSTFTTPSVPYDGAFNYKFYDGNHHWEIVSYSPAVSMQLSDYLYKTLDRGQSPRVELLTSGKAVSTFTIPSEELKALLKTITLGKLLHRQREIGQQQRLYATRFARLDGTDAQQ